MSRDRKTPRPWQPVAYDQSVTAAVKALNAGNANEAQQRLALRWIIEVAAATYDQPFRPESARETDFACGRMFVGQQIVKQLKLTTTANPKPGPDEGRRI